MNERMPVVFLGHGSPMNAAEDNEFSRSWVRLGRELPRPKAILAVSAHWYAGKSLVCADESPRMIYDMYGFPDELYRIKYPAPGAPDIAVRAAELSGGAAAEAGAWGIDHGVWSLLRWMYPGADIPVVPMSVNGKASPETLFETGRKLRSLRDEGVLILASGNVVHNLALVNWGMDGGYDWADEFDLWVENKIRAGKYADIIDWRSAGKCAEKAFSTPDHFLPLLYALGAADENDAVRVINNARTLGALSMTGYVFGK
jgi:4,5-DOPA dioxygenase extradiol